MKWLTLHRTGGAIRTRLFTEKQEAYEKRYAELTARYEKSKAKYDDIAEQIESKKAKRELFKGFIRTLEKQDGLTCELSLIHI